MFFKHPRISVNPQFPPKMDIPLFSARASNYPKTRTNTQFHRRCEGHLQVKMLFRAYSPDDSTFITFLFALKFPP